VIEQGQLPPDDVIKLIEAQKTVWVRLAATRTGDEWHESLMEVTSGIAPPRWIPQRWKYDEAIFLSSEVSGANAAEWFRTDTVTIDDVVVKLLPVQPGQTSQWWQYSGGTPNAGYETLIWPFRSYQLAPHPLKNGSGSGSLIGNGPSFVRFAQAAASFFGFALGLGGSVDHMAPTFRLQDLSGRIARVLLSAAEVEVHLEGVALDGMTVELASDAPGASNALSSLNEQVVRFPLPSGLPPGAWVVLKKDSEWIDRKFINYPHTTPDPGIEIVVEPMTELQALVSGGEVATVEFKSVIPEPETKLRDKVCQTVAAFANEDGGQLLFGVEDDGTITGLPATTDARRARDTVTQFLTSTVTPTPNFSFETIQVDGDSTEVVLVLIVKPGSEPPYGVNPAHPRYYIRRGGTTSEASADQVRALARSRPPADQNSLGAYGLRLGV
jgi:hypothetical protein